MAHSGGCDCRSVLDGSDPLGLELESCEYVDAGT